MVSTSGTLLLKPSAHKTLIKKLFPLAKLVRPNIYEAQKLAGIKIKTVNDMAKACKKIKKLGAKNVLIKGGHLKEKKSTDILFFNGKIYKFSSSQPKVSNIRGTGCMLSAGIASNLAKGQKLPLACKNAKKYIDKIIKNSLY
jgi:hydroxymethylpyrimidine/phosphomethylpyrimidine kinase